MTAASLRCAVLIAMLALLASCGGGGGSDQTACTPSGYMLLHSSSTGTTLLSSVTVSTMQNAPVTPVPVFVEYMSPPVAAMLVGYPPGATDPRTVGMNIVVASSPPANPIEVDLTFDSTLPTATYYATWRFVAVDTSSNIVGCRDLPVTFTVQ
ncbi:MAG: hypothetical protein HGA43_17040 [Nitrospirae bacterium]|nr:hypothetical protein [Nitrospirota bacterium]